MFLILEHTITISIFLLHTYIFSTDLIGVRFGTKESDLEHIYVIVGLNSAAGEAGAKGVGLETSAWSFPGYLRNF